MSVHRAHATPCPLSGVPVGMDICQPCPYFRGAIRYAGEKGWVVTCNWPRNGSSVDPSPPAPSCKCHQ